MGKKLIYVVLAVLIILSLFTLTGCEDTAGGCEGLTPTPTDIPPPPTPEPPEPYRLYLPLVVKEKSQ